MPVIAGAGRSVEQVDGDMTLLGFDVLEKMRAAMSLPSAADVANRAAFVAGQMAGAGAVNRQIEKIAAHNRLEAAIAQWAGVQRYKGRSDSESYRRFYLALGIDVYGALSADRTRQEYEKVAQIVEGWI
jgi:hypothetical protein